MMPNLSHVVQAVRDAHMWDFSTQAGLCAYSRTVILALNARDANFGHLVKREDQPHCVDPVGQHVAVDAVLYRATGQIADFIESAGPRPRRLENGDENPDYPGNAVAWSVGAEGEYPPSSWIAPVSGITPEEPDTDEPADEDTHEDAMQLAALTAMYREIHVQLGAINRQAADLDRRVAEGEGRLTVLEARPAAPPVIVAEPPRRPWWPF